MKSIKLVFSILAIFALSSCMEKGKVIVQNKVHNVRLENISFGDYQVGYSLLPGEESDEYEIRDYKRSFPMIHSLEFYMVGDGNRVYLKTKSSYELNESETLVIIISDTTEVINPLQE